MRPGGPQALPAERSAMKLPQISQPERYGGLYVFDFGEWAAIGYTAEEIAMLLESERYRDGKVYKIHRAYPDGSLELRGLSRERFQLESGLFFYRSARPAARADYEALAFLARRQAPPCRAKLQLADLGSGGTGQRQRFAVALIFPAEYEDEIGAWLNEADYQGGDLAEGGISLVTRYYELEKTILERQQLWGQPAIPARSREEVYASVRRAVQR
jgi:hypothetical protein